MKALIVALTLALTVGAVTVTTSNDAEAGYGRRCQYDCGYYGY
jgi:hypothetical protein